MGLLRKHLLSINIALLVISLGIIIILSQVPIISTNYRNKFVFDDTYSYDVVYTWVNGSDPVFIEQAQKIDPNFNPARFDDKNELKYSLRSLEKYAPWVHHVFIVTNGQIPHWLDLEYEKVSVVTHQQLLDDPNIFPTLSSPVIETFLHHIPNLSKRFLYLNDDIFLGSPLYPEDLFTYENGVNVYTSSKWTVPNCALDCRWESVGDGFCDPKCNIEDCQYDGNDCIENTSNEETTNTNIEETAITNNEGIATNHNVTDDEIIRNEKEQKRRSKSQKKRNVGTISSRPKVNSRDVYIQSLIHTNKIFNLAYGFGLRIVIGHVGLLLDKDIMENMLTKFQKEFSETRSHRFRNKNDMQFSFAYYNYLISEKRSVSLEEIFDRFDTDKSGTWSHHEIRMLLDQLSLDYFSLDHFYEVMTNCSQHFIEEYFGDNIAYTTLTFERNEDSSIQTVTKSLLMNCSPLAEVLHQNFGTQNIYKFKINRQTTTYSNFELLSSNVSKVVQTLNNLQQEMKKFNCINDDLEAQFVNENEVIRNLLQDFYLSYFPNQSKFERSAEYQNQKNYIENLIFAGVFVLAFFLIGLQYFYYKKPRHTKKSRPKKSYHIIY